IPLHGVDAVIPPFRFTVLWHFSPPPNNILINDVLDKLKSSLAQALELYPPLAGTVHLDSNDNYYIDLNDSDGPGTPFYFENKNIPYVNHNSNEGLSARVENKSGPLTSETSVLVIKVT
ncbi:hypothetical protein BDA99DRAFT_408737, partial [Phascolomyces articulosus]